MGFRDTISLLKSKNGFGLPTGREKMVHNFLFTYTLPFFFSRVIDYRHNRPNHRSQ